MSKPQLRVLDDAPSPAPQGPPERPVAMAGQPLMIAGLVVRKAALVAALRAWVPNAVDVAVSEDGENFFIFLGEGASHAHQAAE